MEDKRKGNVLFCWVNPNELETLDEWTEYLDAIIHGPCLIVEINGELILVESPVVGKALVEEIDRGMKVEIYSNEHSPPHFHVLSSEIDASFRIDNCTLLAGRVRNSDYKKILYWYKHTRSMLIKKWNSMRPTECIVSFYKDE